MTEPEAPAHRPSHEEGLATPDASLAERDESLMRRILNDPKQYKHGKILQAAFMPRKQGRDKDGISFQKSSLATPLQFKLSCTDAKIRATCGVVDLPISVFTLLGLTIVPDEVPVTPPDLSGHVTIKDINSDFHNEDFTEAQRNVVRGYAADLAGNCKIPLIVPGN